MHEPSKDKRIVPRFTEQIKIVLLGVDRWA